MLPAIPFYAVQLGAMVLSLASAVGLMVFAIRFPDDRADGWRAVRSEMRPFTFIRLRRTGSLGHVRPNDLDAQLGACNPVGSTPPFPPYAVAWIALIDAYRRSTGTNRLRLRWALIGLFIGTLLPVLRYPSKG